MPGFNMHPQNMAGFPVRSLPGFMNQQFAPFAYHPKDARGSVQPNNHFANVNPGNGDRFLNPAPKEQRSAKSKTDWEEKKMQSSSKDDEARDAASACFTNQFIPTQASTFLNLVNKTLYNYRLITALVLSTSVSTATTEII